MAKKIQPSSSKARKIVGARREIKGGKIQIAKNDRDSRLVTK